MALPPVVKTWQYNINQLVVGTTATMNAQKLGLAIKDALKGMAANGWTVWGSCDGNGGNFGNADGVDRWDVYTKIAYRSWMVLTNPATGMQILFWFHTTTVYNFTFRISVGGEFGAYNAGTNPNGTGTDGDNAGNPPTAGDQSQTYTGNWVYASAGDTYKLHVMESTDGECTRVIACRGNVPTLFWVFDMPSSPITPWTHPVGGAVASDTANVMTYSYWNDTARMYSKIGADAIANYMSAEGCVGSMVGEQLTSQDDDTGEWPIMPVGLFSLSASHRGRKGAVYDLWWGSTGVAIGTAYPNDLTYQFVQFGHFIVPWNGTAPETS